MTTHYRSLRPEPSYIWPEPRILERIANYEKTPPFDDIARASDSMFGVVSALAGMGIDVLESWLKDCDDFKSRLIVTVYPTCLTGQDDLLRLLKMTERYEDRLSIRLRPCKQVTDRPANALCFIQKDSEVIHIATGATECLGFDSSPDGKINFIFRADLALVESFNRYFTWLWGNSREISAEGVIQIPALMLPEGTIEGTRLWSEYVNLYAKGERDGESSAEAVRVDPDTGDVKLVSEQGSDITPPAEEIGLKKLDPFAEIVARIYNKGALVSIDKLSRIPPLDAPLDPSTFGDSAEIHKGNVVRKVSMRVSIIDEKTLKEIDKRRQGLRSLLTKFTFGLADNMRWMPSAAREMFESELKRLNEEGQKLISDLLKGDVKAFIEGKRRALTADIGAMYAELGRPGQVTADVIERVIVSLTARLTKAQSANFMPTLSYSHVGFAPTENAFASPWGQAFSLLSDIVAFPRKAMTDGFFFRGLKVPEENLIEAMNVADDALCRDIRIRGIKERCKTEIDLLSRIEKAPLEPRDRCELVYRILAGDPITEIDEAITKVEST